MTFAWKALETTSLIVTIIVVPSSRARLVKALATSSRLRK